MYRHLRDGTDSTLGSISGLVRLAWDTALAFPEMGDDIIDDLIADVEAIVSREQERIEGEARERADVGALDRVLRTRLGMAADAAAEIVKTGKDGGIDPRGWFVYLLWRHRDAEVPLYVGLSTNIMSRLGSHMDNQDRRPHVGWVTFLRCRTERAMIDLERDLIARYRPEWNIIGIPAEATA